MKYATLYILSISGLILAGCSEKRASVQEAGIVAVQKNEGKSSHATVDLSDKQIKASGIVTGQPEKKSLKTLIKCNGFLKVPPQKRADVSTFMGGVVKTIFVIEGKHVFKGQTLVTLEHPDFTRLQEEYLKSRDNLVFLEKEYLRQKSLNGDNVTARKLFEEAEAKYKAEKNHIASLTDQLQKLSISITSLNEGHIASSVPIKSPITGCVTKINVNTGSYAQPSEMLFEVVNNNDIFVELQLYETDWYKVKEGDKIYITLPNKKDEKIEGEVFSVANSFDAENKTLAVYGHISNNKYHLVPGIYVDSYVDAGSNTVQAVPDDAVIREKGKSYAFFLSNTQKSNGDSVKVFEFREIKTGASSEGYTEVQEEETENLKNMVISGSYYLLSELRKE